MDRELHGDCEEYFLRSKKLANFNDTCKSMLIKQNIRVCGIKWEVNMLHTLNYRWTLCLNLKYFTRYNQ